MIDATRLQRELAATGLSVDAGGSNWTGPQTEPNCSYHTRPPDGLVRLVWRSGQPTAGQIAQADAIVQAHDGRPRRARLPEDIVDALKALTTAQKNAVWADITAGGAAAKWRVHRGPHTSLICTQHSLATATGTSAADVLDAKIHGVAYYCLDNPTYLVNPAFDPSINVPGDEVIA